MLFFFFIVSFVYPSLLLSYLPSSFSSFYHPYPPFLSFPISPFLSCYLSPFLPFNLHPFVSFFLSQCYPCILSSFPSVFIHFLIFSFFLSFCLPLFLFYSFYLSLLPSNFFFRSFHQCFYFSFPLSLSLSLYTHTHTYIYIYIYIYPFFSLSHFLPFPLSTFISCFPFSPFLSSSQNNLVISDGHYSNIKLWGDNKIV